MFDFDSPIDRSLSLKHHPETLNHMFGQSNITPMWVADMDFKVMPQISSALLEAAKSSSFGYLPPHSVNLKFINWFVSQHGVNIQSDWVHNAHTLVQSFHLLLENFTSPECAIIVQSPVYMEFANSINQTGRTVVHNNLLYQNGDYTIDFEELERLASFKNTAALLFCNPHNPVGRVWTETEIQKVVDICLKHNILLISDEVHADIVFKPNTFTSLLKFPEIHSQLAVCYSPAKTFNIASVSSSFVILPNPIMQKKYAKCEVKYNLKRLSPFTITTLNTVFTNGQKWIDELIPYLHKNIRFASQYISDNISNAVVAPVQGTYLMWVDMRAFPLRGMALIRFLATHANVGVVDGSFFGPSGDGFVRINCALPIQDLKIAITAFCSAVQKMPELIK